MKNNSTTALISLPCIIPKREKQFDVLWVLYSYARNERIRVKSLIADGESLPSSVPIWTTANWLEREVFDMFGIKFDGHPDMKRILLPDGWKGHPVAQRLRDPAAG